MLNLQVVVHFGLRKGKHGLHSASLPESTRTTIQRTAIWVVSIIALVAISRTLVMDLNIRMEALGPPAMIATDFPMPASAIAPIIPPPPPRPLRAIDNLIIPVQGAQRSSLMRMFNSPRSGGRSHEAIDILAKRNTPVLAASDGKIVDLSTNPFGGTTIYQLDPSGRYGYYYAHLQRYAKGMREGKLVRQGQIIGFVGTTGNASNTVPHLHFAVYRLRSEGLWRRGTPIDPYDLLVRSCPPYQKVCLPLSVP